MSSFTRFSAEMSVRYDRAASITLGADHWRVMEDFRYYIGDDASGGWVFVPAGYLTDGASVPRLFWNIIPPWGAYGQAAVVHDIVCEYLSVTQDGNAVAVSRSRCDKILLEAMEVIGVPWLTRTAIYAAVSAYRLVSGVSMPSSTPLKRAIEAQWNK
ncbi:phospholipase [Pseudomonas phage AH02]|nr:phospholipase [Pseudomonas phage AH02]